VSRRRYQQGSLKIRCGSWVAQWREGSHRRNRVLGKVRASGKKVQDEDKGLTKTEARSMLAEIVRGVNRRPQQPSENASFGDFVNYVYLPFYVRKWKRSTASCNAYRFRRHLMPEFGSRPLGTFTRIELQDFLDRKTAAGHSFSTVDHLKWDLKQIFGLAVADGNLQRNPAALLLTAKPNLSRNKPVMTGEQVVLLSSVLEPRENLICMLAVMAGMRPGEIFGLQWKHVNGSHLAVDQRVYRGDIDSPKTGTRTVALSDHLQALFSAWRKVSGEPGPECWVFPSETLSTPFRKDNCWRRWINPRLMPIGLEWINFQVMRRTHASRMRELGVNPKTVADQLGHSVDVDLNVYTQTSIEERTKAMNELQSSTFIM
jgi:integrase